MWVPNFIPKGAALTNFLHNIPWLVPSHYSILGNDLSSRKPNVNKKYLSKLFLLSKFLIYTVKWFSTKSAEVNTAIVESNNKLLVGGRHGWLKYSHPYPSMRDILDISVYLFYFLLDPKIFQWLNSLGRYITFR